MKNSLVRLTTMGKEYLRGPFSQSMTAGCGTGFVLENRLIATCAHVAYGQQNIQGSFEDDTELYTFKVVHANPAWDICILTTDNEEFWVKAKELKLGAMPVQGDEIYALGFPMSSTKLKSTGGTIVSIQDDIPSAYSGIYSLSMHIDSEINPGNSGGPLINKQGDVAGMASQNTFGDGKHKIQSYAIPVLLIEHTIRNYLDNRSFKSKVPDINIEWQPLINSLLRKQLKLPEKVLGIIVIGVDKNASYAAHLKKDDVILAIDNNEIFSDGKYLTDFGVRLHFNLILNLKKIGDTVEFMLCRNGNIQLETLTLEDDNADRKLYKRILRYEHPTYFNYNGVVFAPLCIQTIASVNSIARIKFLKKNCSPECLEAIGIDVFFPCTWSNGLNFDDEMIIDKINNVKIRHIWDLIDAFSHDKDVHKVECKAGDLFFIPRMTAEAKNELIEKYDLPNPLYSANLNPANRSKYFSDHFPSNLARPYITQEQDGVSETAVAMKASDTSNVSMQYMWRNCVKMTFGALFVTGAIVSATNNLVLK